MWQRRVCNSGRQEDRWKKNRCGFCDDVEESIHSFMHSFVRSFLFLPLVWLFCCSSVRFCETRVPTDSVWPARGRIVGFHWWRDITSASFSDISSTRNRLTRSRFEVEKRMKDGKKVSQLRLSLNWTNSMRLFLVQSLIASHFANGLFGTIGPFNTGFMPYV